jgi:predicted ribosome quality control (RQC) complex YloA/Tae2 family protein
MRCSLKIRYIQEFKETIESERDRRDLLHRELGDKVNGQWVGVSERKKTSQLSPDMIDSLIQTEISEKEERETKLQEVMSKIEQFSVFKEGCDSELQYYKDIYEEFNDKIKLGMKYQELENYISTDLNSITARVKKMDKSFKKFDDKLDKSQSKLLNKKLAEYQTKFEKLVDVVLNEKKIIDGKTIEPNAVSPNATP